MKEVAASDNDVYGDGVSDFFYRIREEAFPRIEAASVPIYGFQNDEVRQDRTGILFRIADAYFILTAAHNLQAIIQARIPLCADFSVTHHVPIPIVEAEFQATEEGGRDVAAIRLPLSVVEEFPPERIFLTMADMDCKSQPTKGFYALFGFPNAWYRRVDDVQRTDPLAFVGSLYDGEMNPDAFFDPAVHIAMGFDQQAINALTHEEVTIPHINGLSGCGLWRIAPYSKAALTNWNPGKVRLVAIQHRWFSRRCYVQGTWIGHALDLIRDKYPTLQEAMRISYPRGY